jgi:hypothetical protein
MVRVTGAERRDRLIDRRPRVQSKVPFRRADIGEESVSRRFVGDARAERPVALPMQKHVADVEDDVADVRQEAQAVLSTGRVAPG